MLVIAFKVLLFMNKSMDHCAAYPPQILPLVFTVLIVSFQALLVFRMQVERAEKR